MMPTKDLMVFLEEEDTRYIQSSAHAGSNTLSRYQQNNEEKEELINDNGNISYAPGYLELSNMMSSCGGVGGPPPLYSPPTGNGVNIYPITSNSTQYQVPIVVINPTDEPMQIACPFCSKLVITKISKQAGCMTYSACFILMFLGCFWGPCLVPFGVKSMNDIKHKCPNCRQLITIYRRI